MRKQTSTGGGKQWDIRLLLERRAAEIDEASSFSDIGPGVGTILNCTIPGMGEHGQGNYKHLRERYTFQRTTLS